jgi:hypothetical protein
MSLKKWISRLGRKRDAAMEWTGASPQRYKRVSWGFLGGGGGGYFIEEATCFVKMVEVG